MAKTENWKTSTIFYHLLQFFKVGFALDFFILTYEFLGSKIESIFIIFCNE